MTTNLSTIRAEVAELSNRDLILEVVKAIGWTVSKEGRYAIKHNGSRFMLADPKVFNRCMVGSVLDLTSEQIQWARLNEIVSAAWSDPFIIDRFEEALRDRAANDKGVDMCDALILNPRQICECIAMARRMMGC